MPNLLKNANRLIPKDFERENNVSIVKLSHPNLTHKSIKVHKILLPELVNTVSDAAIFDIYAYNKN